MGMVLRCQPYCQSLYSIPFRNISTVAVKRRAVGRENIQKITSNFYKLWPRNIIKMVVLDGSIVTIGNSQYLQPDYMSPLPATVNKSKKLIVSQILIIFKSFSWTPKTAHWPSWRRPAAKSDRIAAMVWRPCSLRTRTRPTVAKWRTQNHRRQRKN